MARLYGGDTQITAADKKAFFASMYALIEKSTDIQLLRVVVRIIAHWIKNSTATEKEKENEDHEENSSLEDSLLSQMDEADANVDSKAINEDLMSISDSIPSQRPASVQVLSSKEKINFLLRMNRFDKMADASVQGAFLDLVFQVRFFYHLEWQHTYCYLQIYTDGNTSAEELKQLESAFLLGLRAKDRDIRNKFVRLYHSRVPCDVGDRLLHIVAGQTWEPLADTFWIRHAAELLLGSIRYTPFCLAPLFCLVSPFLFNRMNDPLTLASQSAQLPALAEIYHQQKKPTKEVRVNPRTDLTCLALLIDLIY